MAIDDVERQRLTRWFSVIRSKYSLPVAAIIAGWDGENIKMIFNPDETLARLVAIEKGVTEGRFGYSDVGAWEKVFFEIKKKAIVLSLRAAYLKLAEASSLKMFEDSDAAAARFRFRELDKSYVCRDVTISEAAGISSAEYERVLANIACAESIGK